MVSVREIHSCGGIGTPKGRKGTGEDDETMRYEMGIDFGYGKDIAVEDRYMYPSAEYPQGSWLHIVDGEVQIATGHYAKEYPDKPSLCFHQRPPFVVMDTSQWKFDGGGPFDAAVDRIIKYVDKHLEPSSDGGLAQNSAR